MSLYLSTATSTMAITAPPSLVKRPATYLYPITDFSLTGDPASYRTSWATDYVQNYFQFHNPYVDKGDWFDENFDPSAASALQSTCSKRWESSVYHWADTVGDPSSGRIITEQFPFTASEPCCSACYYTAGDVQVYHWPISTTAPSITMLVNSDNFTLTYPSVYVAFESIRATDLCGLVGSAISSVTTVGFDVTELSTAVSYWQKNFHPSFADFYTTESWWKYTAMDLRTGITCMDTTTTLWNAGDDVLLTSGDVTYSYTFDTEIDTFSGWSFIATYNPCTPFLSVPTGMIDIEPKWKPCRRNFGGLHDPPILLTTGAAFSEVAQRTSAIPDPTKTNSLSPAQAVQQPSVTKTPPPEAAPLTSKLPAIATMGGSTITANANSGLVFGTKTLTPDGNLIVSGTTLSMVSDGGTLIIDGTSTQALEQPYTVIRQSLASDGSSMTVYGASRSKIATGLGGAKTSDAEFGAEWQEQSSSGSRKMGFSYWIALTVVFCIGFGVL